MLHAIGMGLVVVGLVFMAIGVYGVLALKDFYSRVVITAKVDTVGLITLVFGMMLMHGLTFFTAKLAVILIFELLTNPLATHSVAHSAYAAGFKAREGTDG